MANFLTNDYRNRTVQGSPVDDLSSTTIAGMFIDNADDTIVTTDSTLSDVISAAREPAAASCPSLASKTFGSVAVGVFDAADLTFTALSGDPAEQFIIFKNTGTDSTARVFASWDVTVTPNGGDITVVFNASGIWKY